MDLHHLRVFQAAAQTSSFTAAGRALSISQSTVSLHVKHLEEEFGCLLFFRSRKRVALSDAGRVLLQYAERTFAELKNAELAVREFSTSQRGTICLGVGASTLTYLLPKVLAEYRRKYPLIEILVTTGTTEALLQSLLDHAIDLAIVMSPADALASVEALPLIDEELVVVLSLQHSLAHKSALSPRDLDNLPMISFLRGTAMQVVQQKYFNQFDIQPKIVMELENVEAIKSLACAGMGAALLPVCCVTGPHGRDVVYKKIRGVSMYRHLLLAVTDWRAHPPATRRLARNILHSLATRSTAVAAAHVIDPVNATD